MMEMVLKFEREIELLLMLLMDEVREIDSEFGLL